MVIIFRTQMPKILCRSADNGLCGATQWHGQKTAFQSALHRDFLKNWGIAKEPSRAALALLLNFGQDYSLIKRLSIDTIKN